MGYEILRVYEMRKVADNTMSATFALGTRRLLPKALISQ